MLGALAFVAVRQHQSQAIDAAPFDFTRGNELVDHHLSTVGKVAELGFPNYQRIGIVRGVTVFKAQYCLFRQDGVDDDKRCLIFSHVLQRNIRAHVPAITLLVVNHGMAVSKGATATVLTRQAHGIARGHQRGKGHVLAHAPVHVDLTTAHGGAVGIDLLHQVVWGDRFGNGGQLLGQTLPFGQRDGGICRVGPLLVQEGAPIDGVLALEVGQHRIDGMAAFIQGSAVGLGHVVTQGSAQALGRQFVGVELACAGMLGNLAVHQRLGEHGGVLLVVAQFAEANNVHHHVLAELHAVFQGQLHAQRDGFRIVAIDVQHRRLDHLHDVGAVGG